MYEFHLFGIIDMLEKLQKKLDAELHDAQEDESNAAHASSMKVQDLTDAVSNDQTGVSRSKVEMLKGDFAFIKSCSDRNLYFSDYYKTLSNTGMGKILLEMHIKETRRKDGRWRLTQHFSNIISLKGLDSQRKKFERKFVEHKRTLENMNKNKVLKQILIKEKSDVKAEVEEEKDNIIELNEISLSFNEGESNLKDSTLLRMVAGILHFQR